jgi:hypothetical protein
MKFSKRRKWAIAVFQSLSTFAVTFPSSVFLSGIEGVMQRFDVSAEVATLGFSLYVLGFALGPPIRAPLSEVYGRKSIFAISYTAFSVAAACVAQHHGLAGSSLLCERVWFVDDDEFRGRHCQYVQQGGTRTGDGIVCHGSLFGACTWYVILRTRMTDGSLVPISL